MNTPASQLYGAGKDDTSFTLPRSISSVHLQNITLCIYNQLLPLQRFHHLSGVRRPPGVAHSIQIVTLSAAKGLGVPCIDLPGGQTLRCAQGDRGQGVTGPEREWSQEPTELESRSLAPNSWQNRLQFVVIVRAGVGLCG